MIRFSPVFALRGDSVQVYIYVQKYDTPRRRRVADAPLRARVPGRAHGRRVARRRARAACRKRSVASARLTGGSGSSFTACSTTPRRLDSPRRTMAREHFGDRRPRQRADERARSEFPHPRPATGRAWCSRSRTPPRTGRCSRPSRRDHPPGARGSTRRRASCARATARRSPKSARRRQVAHLVWAIELARRRAARRASRRRSPRCSRTSAGRSARSQRALADFDHPAIHRDFYWDLANARAILDATASLVADAGAAARRSTARRRGFDRHTAPRLASASRGDRPQRSERFTTFSSAAARPWRRANQAVVGIVDFGDMVHSYRIGDLAIAIAYVDARRATIRSRRSRRSSAATASAAPLDEIELDGAVRARRCCGSARARASPRTSGASARTTTTSASARRRSAARCRCWRAMPVRPREGGVPRGGGRSSRSPRAERVRGMARGARRRRSRSVLGVDLATRAMLVLDLSVASPLVERRCRGERGARLTARVFGAMRDAGVRRGDRPLRRAAAALCRRRPSPTRPAPTDEQRTIHLGLDLFARRGHAGVRAARRHRPRVRGQRAAAGLRPGDHPAPRDGRRHASSSRSTGI